MYSICAELPNTDMATLEEAPQPYFPAPGNFPPAQPSVSFPVGDQKWVVPVNADMVTKDGLTVTTSRERLIDAINAAKQQSQSVVDSYEKHKANPGSFRSDHARSESRVRGSGATRQGAPGAAGRGGTTSSDANGVRLHEVIAGRLS